MKFSDLVDTRISIFSAVVPPKANTLTRFVEFYEDPKTQMARDSFLTYVLSSKSSCAGWEIESRHENIQYIIPKYSYDRYDEYARAYISGTKISEALSSKIVKSQNKRNLIIRFAGEKIGGIPIPAPSTKVGKPSKHDAETLLQDKDPDLFMVLAVIDFIEKLPLNLDKAIGIFFLLDIFDIALARLIFMAKRNTRVDRPRTQEQLKEEGSDVEIPRHSSWPGGHAYRAGGLASLLYFVLHPLLTTTQQSELKARLECAACRVSRNREEIGLHWATDTLAGLQLGSICVNGILDYFFENQKDIDSDSADVLALMHLIHK